VGATIGAAVVPNPYRLQAGNTDEATSFENHPMFHKVSLERSAGGDNGRFGAGKSSVRSTKPNSALEPLKGGPLYGDDPSASTDELR
jgi:hypothetical protein